MSTVQRLTHVEDFVIDLSSGDACLCDGVSVDNNVLRGMRDYETLGTYKDYVGLVGANSQYLFAYSNRVFRRYDGESFKNLLVKIPNVSLTSTDVRSDMFRGIPYVAFDQDGFIAYDESNADKPTIRWSFHVAVEDISNVNERIVTLTNNGTTLRFSESGCSLASDVLADEDDVLAHPPTITLPSPVQAICRFGSNVLYALGDVCYKLTFSAVEQDIKVKAIASGLGKVYLHSVKQIGDRVVFAAKQGLYALRKDNITPMFSELNKAVANYEGCRASVWMGKYLFTVPDAQGRCGYVLDVDKGKCVAVFCRDACDVCVFNDKDVMVKSDGELVRFADDAYRIGLFTRSRIDFGNCRRKHLRRLNITTKYDVNVALTDDNGVKRNYFFKGSDKMQSVRIYGSGRAFDMQIRSCGQMEVSSLAIVAEAYKEVSHGS